MPRVRPHRDPAKVEYHFPRAERVPLAPGREVEVELGCAEAQFLFERAAAEPGREYVGVEIRDELVALVNDKARALGAPVRAVFAHANIHFAQLFAPGSLARVHVLFPDPWFKTRQKKRRVVTPALVDDICATLRPGGELFFASDIWDLSLDALAVFESCPLLDNRAGAWSFWKDGNPYGARSRREAGCEAEGLPVWRIWYTRRRT